MLRVLDVASSTAASLLRLGLGRHAGHQGERPRQPLHLYEFEACPFCRRVREALTALDLCVLVFPCPKGGQRFRPEVQRKGGRLRFPYFEDLEHGVAMYESAAIVRYLYGRYGSRSAPWWLTSDVTLPLSSAASVLRARGIFRQPSVAPAEPLVFYGYEASPTCRIVRETLCELELPYELHNVGKGSPLRPAFETRAGRMMVPWLHDPNTGHALFEAMDIRAYLRTTYGMPARG